MNTKNWKDTFESVGMLAIVASLIFVALQLRQDQRLVRSQLGAGTTELNAAISMAAQESEFQKTFVKMINEPDQLSDEEIVEISLFLGSIKGSIRRECYLVERGVFAECDNMTRGRLRNYFQNEFAKSWWRQNSEPGTYIPDWVDAYVEELDANGNRRKIAELRESVQ